MKIGILTFHSQLNYGGVLQCWALQQALTRLLSEKREVISEKRGGETKVRGEPPSPRLRRSRGE